MRKNVESKSVNADVLSTLEAIYHVRSRRGEHPWAKRLDAVCGSAGKGFKSIMRRRRPSIHLTRNAANATGGKIKPVQSTTWRSAQRLWFARGANDRVGRHRVEDWSTWFVSPSRGTEGHYSKGERNHTSAHHLQPLLLRLSCPVAS